jgi:hypothetical protein
MTLPMVYPSPRLLCSKPLSIGSRSPSPASDAFSNAKGLRLHVLGPGYQREPPADPGFPPGPSGYAREMSSRAVHDLLFTDQIFACIAHDTVMTRQDPAPMRFAPGKSSQANDDRILTLL